MSTWEILNILSTQSQKQLKKDYDTSSKN